MKQPVIASARCSTSGPDAPPGKATWPFAIILAAAALGYDPAATAVTAKRALLLLVGLAALALIIPVSLRGERKLMSTAGVPWLALCGWSAASLWWCDHPDPLAVGIWLAAAALVIVVSDMSLTALRQLAGRCATLIIGGSALVCLWQVSQQATPHGLHGNPNWLGLVVACALPLSVDHLLCRAHRFERRAVAACLVLGAITLLVSGSRAAWIAVALSALVFGARRWRWLIVAPLSAGLGYAWLAGDLMTSMSGRLWLWRATLAAIWRSLPSGLLLGQGAGAFPFAYLDAQGKQLAALGYDQAALRFHNATSAHNDWLQLLLEGGLPALWLAAGALGIACWRLRRSWPGGAACALVVSIAAAGDAPLRLAPVVMLLALVLAATSPLEVRRADKLLALATLLAAVALLPRAAAGWIGQRRLTSARTVPLDDRARLLSAAAEASPHDGEIALALGLTELELGRAGPALTSLARSRALLANLGTDVAIGNAHMRLDDTDAAISAYRRAIRRHPALFRARANLTEALRRAGRLDEAQAQLAVARELMPNHPKLRRMAEQLRRDRIDADTRR